MRIYLVDLDSDIFLFEHLTDVWSSLILTYSKREGRIWFDEDELNRDGSAQIRLIDDNNDTFSGEGRVFSHNTIRRTERL